MVRYLEWRKVGIQAQTHSCRKHVEKSSARQMEPGQRAKEGAIGLQET